MITLRWALVYFDILIQMQTWETDTQSEKHIKSQGTDNCLQAEREPRGTKLGSALILDT